MSFEKFNLHPSILQALEEEGYKVPTPVQDQVIPAAIAGQDILACAPTGTGKTAAFTIPALEVVMKGAEEAKETDSSDRDHSDRKETGRKFRGPKVLILAPTRELATQITGQVEKYGKYLPKFKAITIFGGTSYHIQEKDLKRHHEVLVATPGRLIDWIDRGKIDFSQLQLLIIDEADRMIDMGFIIPVKQIVSKLPKNRQTLLFSATLEGQSLKLANELLKSPKEIHVKRDVSPFKKIDQKVIFVDGMQHKLKVLEHLLANEKVDQAIVFTATKSGADGLAESLSAVDGIRCEALHGDMNQRQRNRTIDMLRNGKCNVLIATDVAARGIDITTITHVFNYDMPFVAEDYIHRVGRTGRAEKTGSAFSFISNRDRKSLKQVEDLLGIAIPPIEIPGLESTGKRAGGSFGGGEGRRRSFGGGAPFRSAGGSRFSRDSGSRDSRPDYSSQRPRAFAPRFGAGRSEGRPERSFEARSEGRPERRFESRSDARPERSFEPRGEGRSERAPGPFVKKFGADRPDVRPERTPGPFVKRFGAGKPEGKGPAGFSKFGAKPFGRPSGDKPFNSPFKNRTGSWK